MTMNYKLYCFTLLHLVHQNSIYGPFNSTLHMTESVVCREKQHGHLKKLIFL